MLVCASGITLQETNKRGGTNKRGVHIRVIRIACQLADNHSLFHLARGEYYLRHGEVSVDTQQTTLNLNVASMLQHSVGTSADNDMLLLQSVHCYVDKRRTYPATGQ